MADRELAKVSGRRGGAGRAGKGSLQRARQANVSSAAAPTLHGFGGGGMGVGGRGGYGGGSATPAMRGQALVGNSAVAFDLDRGRNVNVTTVQLIGRKTFFYRGGRWVDASLTDDEEKNAQKIDRYGDKCFELVRAHGKEIGMYLALDEPVVVKLDDQVYQW